ncbi:glycosyltransferase family 2 protein [Streptomyces sp. NBC_01477]|uniref:glycosyltransferase family 2 protein n=1 Tax=Streptomyces sp. NBC_01477 TaxID=2976015 RepID=UPI002E30C580|nr:glycosyltransferase family A protein [Streptomyces sp. NBC_01477]
MISVVIPTHHRPHLLPEALASLSRQVFGDFEVVVVNDGGPTLVDVLRPWRDRLPLRLFELPRRTGVSHARNVGIDHAEGEYLAFLDDDDIFLPRHLARAYQALALGRADFVYCSALVAGERMSELPERVDGGPVKAYPFDDDFLLVANFIHTGAVVVRSFRETGVRFDESLTHCEDWDMWLALRRRLGYRVSFVDEITAIYHQLPAVEGLVGSAQLAVPSPFTVVRERIQDAWPASDGRVRRFRAWMNALEDHRNTRIRKGHAIPHQMFDAVLHDTHAWFTAGMDPDFARIPDYFRAAV